MLRFRKAKSDAVTGFLGSQTEFVGKLSFSGIVHLDGHFEGEIVSRGTLVVGSESVVHAEIQSNILKVSGEVHGDLTASERIELYPPAKVFGNIRTPSLTVEEGVIFEGTCKMASVREAQSSAIPVSQDIAAADEEALEEISAQAWPPPYDLGSAPEEAHADKSASKHD